MISTTKVSWAMTSQFIAPRELEKELKKSIASPKISLNLSL
jgi:hypothetical protein